MVEQRSGAMGSSEVVSGNIEFYTLFTSIDLTRTGDYTDNTQKDFESVVILCQFCFRKLMQTQGWL